MDEDANGEISRAEWAAFIKASFPTLCRVCEKRDIRVGSSEFIPHIPQACTRQEVNFLLCLRKRIDEDVNGEIFRAEWAAFVKASFPVFLPLTSFREGTCHC